MTHGVLTKTWIEGLLHRIRLTASAWASGHGWWAKALYELVVFGAKQAWACLFGALMLALMAGTHLFYPSDAPLARYDFLVLAALSIQALLLATKMETWPEARVILLYHVVGTVMEVFKTHVGSCQYPEPSVLRIGGVPLFSGFMYASVGSFIARSWRLLSLEFDGYPQRSHTLILALLIYANFFTHHWILDLRWMLFAATAGLFWRTRVHFRVADTRRSMPLLLSFGLIALFIWMAENVGTWSRAWRYPSQMAQWHVVGFGKLGSWYLLMIISFVLVTWVHPPRSRAEMRRRERVRELVKACGEVGAVSGRMPE